MMGPISSPEPWRNTSRLFASTSRGTWCRRSTASEEERMRMVRVFLRTAPMALLLVACVITPPPEQPPASAATYYELGGADFEGGDFRLGIPEISQGGERSA